MKITYSTTNSGSQQSTGSDLSLNNLSKVFMVIILGFAVMVVPVIFGLWLKYGLGIIFDSNSVAPLLIGIAVYGLLVLFYLFPKAGSWATTIKADPNVPKLASVELTKKLNEINNLDVPFTVNQGKQANELIVQWRVADQKWLGLMFAGKLKFIYTLTIRLDEGRHIAYIREKQTSASWDVSGPTPLLHANFSFSLFRGINLFNFKSAQMTGILWKDGKLVVDNAYQYTFSPDEVKGPVSEIVTKSGWDFAPTV